METGDVLYAENRLYKVLSGGKLKETPPMNTDWLNQFTEGSATLSFIGRDWQGKSWWANSSYCISYSADNTPLVYQLIKHDGITSGDFPVPGSGRTVDGDMVWQYTETAATKEWSANTQFYKGDIVSFNGRNYQCIFDGRLELPHRTVLENIATNMSVGDVFSFYHDTSGGTDIPTRMDGKWKIIIKDVEVKRFKQYQNGYFCHSGNPQPVIIDCTHSDSGIQTIAEFDVSGLTKIDSYSGSADASGNISAYTFTKLKNIPNNTTVHFKAILFCPTGVKPTNNGKTLAVSDFTKGRAWENANAYCTTPVIKDVTGGTNYILDWDEPISVTDTNKVEEDDLTNGTVTYYCCTEISLTGDSTQYTKATLTVSAYKA